MATIDWSSDQKEVMADVGYERSEPVQPKAVADMVNNPPHYNQGDIECIDAIESALGKEGFEAYCRGNAIKYLWRIGLKHRDNNEDWEKANWYINRAFKKEATNDT